MAREGTDTVELKLGRTSNRTHLAYVDGMRALAALYVVLSHAWLQTWPVVVYGDHPSGWTMALTGWMNYGALSVVFFIVISGFCLMLPVVKRDGTLGPGGSPEFFGKRARRILPPYYAAFVLSFLVGVVLLAPHTHSLYDETRPFTLKAVILHLLLLHNLQTDTLTRISVPFWSIAVECQIYLFFPLLISIRRRFGTAAVVGGTYIVGLALSGLTEKTSFKGLVPIYLFYFALGMFAAEVIYGKRTQLYVWIGASAGIVYLAFSLKPFLLQMLWAHLLVAICGMCALIVCAQWPGNPLARFCAWRPVAWIGSFSYSLYLIHFPVQQLIWQDLVRPLGLSKAVTFAVMATLGTALIVLFSYGFYLVFERPFTTEIWNRARVRQPAEEPA
ncbi:MAG: acyltransferase [Alphaproteobacteria bacterium]|nr:acyltransferase [Alphaproteobacteria bacterium]